MIKAYCASCHGISGKGNGPAASALKKAPADLTLLARTNAGKFPEEAVGNFLPDFPAGQFHGSAEMPVWGPLLTSVSNGSHAESAASDSTIWLRAIQSM